MKHYASTGKLEKALNHCLAQREKQLFTESKDWLACALEVAEVTVVTVVTVCDVCFSIGYVQYMSWVCCIALPCLFDHACFFLLHLSLTCTYMYMYIHELSGSIYTCMCIYIVHVHEALLVSTRTSNAVLFTSLPSPLPLSKATCL